MNNEIDKEISRIQLLSARYKNKLKMCPFEIKKEELRAFYINTYINNLRIEYRQELEEKDKVIDEAIKYLIKLGKQPDADMYYCINEHKEYTELLELLERGKK